MTIWPLLCTPWLAGLGIAVAPIIDLSGRPVKPFLHLVQKPFRVITFGESFPEVLLFLFEATQDYCTWWRPCGRGFGWHWIWLRGDGGCPTCKYWSVCVGFLYTVMDREPSASGLTIVSKKGMDPSSLLSSTVNLIAGSTLFMCWRKPCLLTSLWMTKVSSTYLPQNLGGWGQYLELFASKYSMYRLATMGLTEEPHGSTLNLFIELALEREVGVFETKLQKEDNVPNFHNCSFLEGGVFVQ